MYKYNNNDGIEYESEDDGIEYYMYWCDSEDDEYNPSHVKLDDYPRLKLIELMIMIIVRIIMRIKEILKMKVMKIKRLWL